MRLGDDETLLVQSRQAGRRVRDPRGRAARAHRQLQPRPRLGDLGDFRELDARRADDVRADDRRARGSTSAPRASCRAPTRRSPRSRASASAARCAGRLVVTAGLGGMGGAQPLAVTMNGGAALCIEVDLQRIERRIETRLPRRARRRSRRRAGAAARRAARAGRPLSIGLLGNAAEVLPELVRRGVARRRRDRPDLARTTRSTATSRRG